MRRNLTFKNSSGMWLTARCGSLAMMLIAIVALGFDARTGSGQTKGYRKAIEVPAGLDSFTTVEDGSYFQFAREFTIPAGFFDKDSRPFTGRIRLKGVPLGSYEGKDTGKADTIVQRTKDAVLNQSGARATVPIVMAALSLESAEPISVLVGRETQRWKVRLTLSPTQKSEGTMTLLSRSENGGTFNSSLVVYTLMTFTRESDGQERQLDTGKMKFGKGGIELLTVSATAVPWVLSCRQVGSGGFCAGVNAGGQAVIIGHNAPRHRHLIILPNRDL